MKYTINGFSQKKLIEFGLNLTDSIILRWFVDFHNSGGMKSKIIDGKEFYWVMYDYLLQEIPIIEINNKRVLSRHLKKMVNCGVLDFRLVKQSGNYTYYRLGDNYNALISDSTCTQEYTPMYHTVRTYVPKGTNKDSSIIDPSIKYNNNDVDKIYNAYPNKCIISNRATGKGSNDKKKIKKLLQTHTADELIGLITLEINSRKNSKTYLRNFSTFLNNLPDPNQFETVVHNDVRLARKCKMPGCDNMVTSFEELGVCDFCEGL